MKLPSVKDKPQQHIKSVLFFPQYGINIFHKTFLSSWYISDRLFLADSQTNSFQERRWIWHLIMLGSILQNTKYMYGGDLPALDRAYWQRLIWTKDFIIQQLSIQTFQYCRIHITCLTFLYILFISCGTLQYTIQSYALLPHSPTKPQPFYLLLLTILTLH